MITLEKNELIQIKLAGAVSVNQAVVTVRYRDGDGKKVETKVVETNDGSDVEVLGGTVEGREVVGLSIHNADTAAITFTLEYENAAGDELPIKKNSLQTLEAASWNAASGWEATDVDANRKTNAPASSGASSTALAAAAVADSKAVSVALAVTVAASVDVSLAVVAASVDVSLNTAAASVDVSLNTVQDSKTTSVASAVVLVNSKLTSHSL